MEDLNLKNAIINIIINLLNESEDYHFIFNKKHSNHGTASTSFTGRVKYLVKENFDNALPLFSGARTGQCLPSIEPIQCGKLSSSNSSAILLKSVEEGNFTYFGPSTSFMMRQTSGINLYMRVERDRPMQVDDQDESGNTPLHLALAEGNEEAVESLLRKGAGISTDSAMTFPRKSTFFRKIISPGGTIGALRVNSNTVMTFPEEVDVFSQNYLSGWNDRGTRYKFKLGDDYPRGSRRFFAKLSLRVPRSVLYV
ncbi:unnamed protein product [Trichogramma brassicae]|uniref:Uncharacterized protein n=1 Tax=Trichogramma brassicae TaxID=86971 RepID=A0A6H5I5E5_9HYME|nr:unnamed protein product [Trichogramma brassicae]